jgi:ribose transport system substrate-binding protein
MKGKRVVLTVLATCCVVVLLVSEGIAQKKLVIGMACKSLTNPAIKAMADSAKATGDKMGVEVIVLSSQGFSALEEQIHQVEDLIQKKVDVIGIQCVDSKGVIPVIQEANKKNIPVIAFDTGADGGKLATFVATDNLKAGRLAGEWMVEQLQGQGKIAMIEGTPGSQQGRDRRNGFHEVIGKQKGIKMVKSIPANFERAKGMEVMEDILTSTPDLNGVFCANDEMALGAVEALKQRKLLGKVVLLGMNGVPEALKSTYKGEMQGTVVQYLEYVGEMFVRSAIRASKGEKLPTYIDTGVSIADTKSLRKLYGSFNFNPAN